MFGEPTIGREEIDTVDIRKRWGVLFQGGALFSTLTVSENIQVPLKEFYPSLDPVLMAEIAAYLRPSRPLFFFFAALTFFAQCGMYPCYLLIRLHAFWVPRTRISGSLFMQTKPN